MRLAPDAVGGEGEGEGGGFAAAAEGFDNQTFASGACLIERDDPILEGVSGEWAAEEEVIEVGEGGGGIGGAGEGGASRGLQEGKLGGLEPGEKLGPGLFSLRVCLRQTLRENATRSPAPPAPGPVEFVSCKLFWRMLCVLHGMILVF